MGMFDSFCIDLDGRELEIQTKRFDCMLGRYRLGDWVGGVAPGVRVYFDVLRLDAEGRRNYRADVEPARTLTLFCVLAHGVFVEYQVRDGALAADAVERSLKELKERWSDSARLLGFLAEALRAKQQEAARLGARLARVSSVVESARRLRAGETLGARRVLIHEEERKLANGEDPLEVVAWVLGDQDAGWGLWGDGTSPDPLDEYRL
jgi:hypothetical protein